MTHHTDTELKPCPFCGSKAYFEIDDAQWQWVECGGCGMQGNRSASLMEDCKPKLAEAWNSRAPAAPVLLGWKPVPVELLERIQESLGSFVSDHGWSQSDMDTADALDGLLAAAPQPPEADHIPDAGKMDANEHNRMKAALSKDVACPDCGLSGLHACPSASTTAPHCADAVTALEKVLRAVQRHLPPERIGERETIAEIISIVDPWPLGKPPEPWKDHMTAELVGKLTDVARQFHGTQQLRERIAGLVRPVCERIKQFDGDRMPEGDMGNHISAAAPVQLPEIDAGWFKYDKVSRCWHPQYSEYAETHAKPQGWQKLYTEQQVRALLEAKASVSNGTLSDVCQRENLREGEPYDNPAFEALARALGVWGTAQSAVCAQFWIAAKEQST